jgi:ABC-type transporter Mla subunit MlaD
VIAPQSNRWKLGLFVTLVAALAVGALIALGVTELDRQRLPAVTYFDETVQGLDAGSPLKWRGVTIGSVQAIGVAPDRRHVEVHMDVYSDLLQKFGVDVERLFEASGAEPLREKMMPDMRVRLVSAGITGLKFLELDRLPDAPVPDLPFDVPHNYVPSAPSVLAGLEMGVTRTVEMLPDLLHSIDVLVTSIDGVVTEFRAADLARTLASILQWIDKELKKLDEAGARSGLDAAASSLRQTLDAARGALVAVEDTARTLQGQLEAADAGATAAAVRAAAGSLVALGNETGAPGAGLGAQLVALRETLERARQLLELIEQQPDALLAGRPKPPAPQR